MALPAASSVRLDVDAVDEMILALSFVTVLGVGVVARRYVKTSLDTAAAAGRRAAHAGSSPA